MFSSEPLTLEQVNALITALSCLPRWALQGSPRRLPEDDTRALVHRPAQLDVMTMDVLDAFASVCVSEPDDTFAVTYEITSSTVRLFVAPGSAKEVSGLLCRHLPLVWAGMARLAAHPDSSAVRDTYEPTPLLLPLHREFVGMLYRFSWPALRRRVSLFADAAIESLDRLSNLAFVPDADTSLYKCSPDTTEHERTYFKELSSSLKALSVLTSENVCTDAPAIHKQLKHLREHLIRPDAVAILQHLDALTGSAIGRDLLSITWLAHPIDRLRTFAHSEAFARMRNLELVIVVVPPLKRPFHADLEHPVIHGEACNAYRNGRRRLDPNLESDFAEHLLAPFRRRCSRADTEPLVLEVPSVPVHAECVLFAYLLTNEPPPKPSIDYIATSEPSCLPCYRYFSNTGLIPRPHLRGTSGDVPLYWVAPDIQASMIPLFFMQSLLSADFRAAFSVIRDRLSATRQTDNDVEWQADDDEETRDWIIDRLKF